MFSSRRPPKAFGIERDLECRTDDGIVLRADVYRPTDGSQRYPVLLSRTPYSKTHPMYVSDAEILAGQGYIVVVQDVRGRYRSDGDFDWCYSQAAQPIEARDGYAAVEWAASLPGSDGQVGTFGTSYPTWCSWRLAAARPPSLRAIYVSGIAPHMTVYNYGCLDLGRRLQWIYQLAADVRRRGGEPFGPYDRFQADDIWRYVFRDKWVWRLPLDSIPDEVFSMLAPLAKSYFRDMTKDFWRFDEVHHRIDAAVCCMTSWWDRQAPTIDNFTGMRDHGPAANRDRHRLVIGPWSHNTAFMRRKLGPRDYGPYAEGVFADLLLHWYDARLKGIDNGLDREPLVRFFLLTDNRWCHAENWPLPGTAFRELFLRGAGSANTARGDGRLEWGGPAESESPDRYSYDPADPVMSLMGADTQHAPCDQSPLDGRRDVLVYQSAPLTEDLLLVGPVKAVVWAASDARDTDFTLKLIEVGPDGLAINLSFGIVRGRYRGGPGTDAPLERDKAYEFAIDLMPVGIRFRRGSRIRLDIASADFPNFDRNHNVGDDDWASAELRVARQTMFHDARRPSRLILPVVPEQAIALASQRAA